MSKRALLRFATSICFMLCVLFLGQVTVFAETNTVNNENNEVVLHYEMIADDNFKFYISESDTEEGDFITGAGYNVFSKGDINLKAGKTYFLHIVATDIHGVGWYAGYFSLDGEFFKFNNNKNELTTNVNDFKVSKTGFGVDYLTPTSSSNYNKFPSIAQCIWTDRDTSCTRYFSTTITPIQNTSLNLTASGGDSKIDLTWDAVDKATSYTVKRATTAGGPYTVIANDITDTSYTDTDVTSGTTYYYIVSSVNTGTEITNSNEASAQPTESQTPPATDSKLKVVLEVSEVLRLSVDDDLDVNTQMAWTSSEPTVATVNEKGIVTALAPGNTVITVKSADGSYTDYINVLVVENADDYRLAIDLKIGETARLTADDFTNTANITWAPMDSSIANVTSKGKVTALSKGLVLISAKDAEGNIVGRVYVRVRE